MCMFDYHGIKNLISIEQSQGVRLWLHDGKRMKIMRCIAILTL